MELTLTGASLLSDKGGSISRRRGGQGPSSSTTTNMESIVESDIHDDDKDFKRKLSSKSLNQDTSHDHSTHSGSHSHTHSHHQTSNSNCSHDHHHHHNQRQLATIESVPIDQLLSNPVTLFQAILVTIQTGRFSTFEYLCNAVLNYEASHGTMNVWVAEDEPSTLKQIQPISTLARRSEDGFYLCHWASKRADDYRFLDYLMAIPSVNVHVPSTDSVGMYPMHWAATIGSIALVNRILKHLNRSDNASNITDLSMIPSADDNDFINCRDKTGCTPLLIAAQYGHADLVAFLIKRGANPFAVDDSKDTALHWAGYKGSVPVCSLLLHLIGLEGHLNLADSFGQTPLHLASLRGNLEVVQYFLEEAERCMEKHKFSDVLLTSSVLTAGEESQQNILFRIMNHQDRDGKTPLGLAVKKEKGACELVLREYIEKYQGTDPSTISLVRKNILLFFSMKNWIVWMGLSSDSSKNIASIQFVFWFVLVNLFGGTVMEFCIFTPISVFSRDHGRLQDCNILNNCAAFFFFLTWFFLILVNRTNPGIIGIDASDRKHKISMICQENKRIELEMERLTKNLQAEYNITLESFANDEGSNIHDENLLCHSCRIAKPLRSKHCRIKNRCILLFDHYCPFVGNTVGLYNYKYFFLFLVCFTVNEIIFIYSWILHVYRGDRFEIWIFLSSVYFSLYILMTTGLLIYHSNLVVANLTTNEHQNISKYKYLRHEGRFSNPFNKGFINNLTSRFFPNRDSYTLPSFDSTVGEDTKKLVENIV